MDSGDSRIGQDIAISIAEERRPTAQIGSEVDYLRITRGVRVLVIGVIAFVVILLVLSMVIPVDEVTRARGSFIPAHRVQVIQTPEGGAIEQIYVKNDDQVSAGQPIARFRATDLLRDIDRTTSRLAYLQIQIERLDAFTSKREPDFASFQKQYPTMVKDAQSQYAGQLQQLQSSLVETDRQIDEQKSSIAAAQQEIPAAKSSMDANQEVLQRVRQGVAEGVVPRNRVAQAEDAAAQAQRTYTQLATSVQLYTAKIQTLQAAREAIVAKSMADAGSQRAELMEQLSELQATAAAYKSRSTDIEVKAPVNGIIQKISETPIGTVIQAGGTVCEIVPTDGGVLMQAQVSTRDIGFVRVGDKASVKSDAFDFSRFGSVPGKVARIAATDTRSNAGALPYITAEIELDQPYVGTDRSHVVTPGMTGEAAILTGTQTVFQYLLKPFYTLNSAFTER